MLSSWRWSSLLESALGWLSSPVSSVKSRISAIIPSSSPIVVRVERIFSSSALICAIMAAPRVVSSRKISSSEEPSVTSS